MDSEYRSSGPAVRCQRHALVRGPKEKELFHQIRIVGLAAFCLIPSSRRQLHRTVPLNPVGGCGGVAAGGPPIWVME
jgi:hypothetical protein